MSGAPLSRTILIVDDTPANLAVLFDALAGAGHRVRVAESGGAALEAVAVERPDLLLLDVLMPGLDGFETCRRLRATAAGRDLPVIVLTAVHEPEEKVRAFAAGGVDFVTKPIHPPEVLARIGAHLQLQELRRDLERRNAELADEVALRVDAEAQLAQFLGTAVVVAERDGRILFATRLARDLVQRQLGAPLGAALPAALTAGGRPPAELKVRRFHEPGRDDLDVLCLEGTEPQPSAAAFLPLGLTPREAEVLVWLAEGKSNPDIATILGMSVRTVHKHVEHIFQKLGVETRGAALRRALEHLRAPR